MTEKILPEEKTENNKPETAGRLEKMIERFEDRRNENDHPSGIGKGITILVIVMFVVLTITSFILVPAGAAITNPSIVVSATVINTRNQDHNYVTGHVSFANGQTVSLCSQGGVEIAREEIGDTGFNKTFAIEIPKVNEGTSYYQIKQIQKDGTEDKPILITVNCKLIKDENSDVPGGSNAKLNAIINELCWSWGEKKKAFYGSGSPKDAYVHAAQKYLGNEVGEIKRGKQVAFTDCSYFVATVVRMYGADPKFRALRFDYAKKNDDWIVVSEGKKVDSRELIAGDIIQYKKNGGGKHVLMYLGNNLYAQASRNNQFPRVLPQKRRGGEMYNAAKVDISSLQVIRNRKIAADNS